MIKVFIPENKGKNKTKVRGFWRNDKGKNFYDYLNILNTSWSKFITILDFKEYLLNLKKKYNQECIFYKDNFQGFIFYDYNRIEVLSHRIYKEISQVDLKRTIKEALRDFSGCTVYIEAGRYFIEVFYK